MTCNFHICVHLKGVTYFTRWRDNGHLVPVVHERTNPLLLDDFTSIFPRNAEKFRKAHAPKSSKHAISYQLNTGPQIHYQAEWPWRFSKMGVSSRCDSLFHLNSSKPVKQGHFKVLVSTYQLIPTLSYDCPLLFSLHLLDHLFVNDDCLLPYSFHAGAVTYALLHLFSLILDLYG